MSDQPVTNRTKETPRLLRERRTGVRFPSQLGALVRPVGDETGMVWPGRVRDISAKGVGLILGLSFAPGTILTVELLCDGGRGFPVEVEVLRVLAESCCGYVHGCQFTHCLTADELASLVK